MAKLGMYYALCPLIDAKSLLGIAEDSEKGFVVVTLGRNIASRYKISDQKQLTYWRTKDKFSSPVVYDKNSGKYVASFNHSYIKFWESEENLDKVKKYKFNKEIYTIITIEETSLVIFKNGSVSKLDKALEERKVSNADLDLGINNIDDLIYKQLKNQIYIGLITKTENDCKIHWTVYGESGAIKYSTIDVFRDELNLIGYTFQSKNDGVVVLTFWSDGSIFSKSLNAYDDNNVGEFFAVVATLSAKYFVSMVSLDEKYIAIYGANSNEEGAVLIIYNTQFKVTQSKLTFKLFTNGAKLSSIENNLILPVGQNLAIIPFHLETEQLAALVGSHKLKHDSEVHIISELEVANWDEKYKLNERDVPEKLKPKISEFVYQGLPENMIIEEILPEILEKRDVSIIFDILKYFSDIPEKYLAKILKFVLTVDSSCFASNKCELFKVPEVLQPIERIKLIDNILRKSFTDILLLPHLKSELSLNEVLLLLNYIAVLFSEDGCVLPSMNFIETEARLIEWSCVLIDSSYQKLVLSKDESVKNVLINLKKLIDDHLNSLEELKLINPLLLQFKKQVAINSDFKFNNLRYSIEQISLY